MKKALCLFLSLFLLLSLLPGAVAEKGMDPWLLSKGLFCAEAVQDMIRSDSYLEALGLPQPMEEKLRLLRQTDFLSPTAAVVLHPSEAFGKELEGLLSSDSARRFARKRMMLQMPMQWAAQEGAETVALVSMLTFDTAFETPADFKDTVLYLDYGQKYGLIVLLCREGAETASACAFPLPAVRQEPMELYSLYLRENMESQTD